MILHRMTLVQIQNRSMKLGLSIKHIMRHPYSGEVECEESRLIGTRLTFFHAHSDGNMQVIAVLKFVD